MKNIIRVMLIAICVITLSSGCSYSDITNKNNNDNNGNDNIDVIDNDDSDNVDKETIVSFGLNEVFTVPDIAEINITSVSTAEEVKPPKTSSVYSYLQDQSGETFVVLKGTFKNLLSVDFDDWSNFSGKLVYDDNYEYDVAIKFATDSSNDFYTDPKPLQTLKVYLVSSIPSELVTTDKKFSIRLNFTEDYDGVSKATYKYDFKFNN